MIEAGGKQFITLDDDIYVDGQKVMAAYVNGTKVYPETSGHGMTCIEALFVGKARIMAYGTLPYLYTDWGDGTTLYRTIGSDTIGKLVFDHEYDDYKVHKVTISVLADQFSGLEFDATRLVAQDTKPCPSPESYALWCGATNRIVEPDDPILSYQRRILQAYAGVMLDWDINPKPPTIGCYITLLSSERIQMSSTGNLSLDVKFDDRATYRANDTDIGYNGYNLPGWWH